MSASSSGLSPAVAVGQRTSSPGPRSTVGTLTEIHDDLRLLFARLGRSPDGPAPVAADVLVQRRRRRLPGLPGAGRRGPHRPRSPRRRPGPDPAPGRPGPDDAERIHHLFPGDHGGPGRGLPGPRLLGRHPLERPDRRPARHRPQRSDRILIRYGKHPLESRLRWKGIVAKPREEGSYKGILPVMETILKTKRNDNILRFARTLPCRACGGRRLRPESLRVTVSGRSIADLGAMSVRGLAGRGPKHGVRRRPARAAGEAVREAAPEKNGPARAARARLSAPRPGRRTRSPAARSSASGSLRRPEAGCGAFSTSSTSRPPGFIRPTRPGCSTLVGELRDNGNTVLVVEHDEDVMRAADHIVDLGPGRARRAAASSIRARPPASRDCRQAPARPAIS